MAARFSRAWRSRETTKRPARSSRSRTPRCTTGSIAAGAPTCAFYRHARRRARRPHPRPRLRHGPADGAVAARRHIVVGRGPSAAMLARAAGTRRAPVAARRALLVGAGRPAFPCLSPAGFALRRGRFSQHPTPDRRPGSAAFLRARAARAGTQAAGSPSTCSRPRRRVLARGAGTAGTDSFATRPRASNWPTAFHIAWIGARRALHMRLTTSPSTRSGPSSGPNVRRLCHRQLPPARSPAARAAGFHVLSRWGDFSGEPHSARESNTEQHVYLTRPGTSRQPGKQPGPPARADGARADGRVAHACDVTTSTIRPSGRIFGQDVAGLLRLGRDRGFRRNFA